jgi:hypothetical protein
LCTGSAKPDQLAEIIMTLKGKIMAEKLIETIHGDKHKYEIWRIDGFFNSHFNIWRDGKRWKSDYNSLSKAVDAARQGG